MHLTLHIYFTGLLCTYKHCSFLFKHYPSHCLWETFHWHHVSTMEIFGKCLSTSLRKLSYRCRFWHSCCRVGWTIWFFVAASSCYLSFSYFIFDAQGIVDLRNNRSFSMHLRTKACIWKRLFVARNLPLAFRWWMLVDSSGLEKSFQ